ncbi:MAG: hypothetical protein K1X83_13735 [Oligoflexia bacterium]|nr:hypothetical protein [Oligoflexia bacterium]
MRRERGFRSRGGRGGRGRGGDGGGYRDGGGRDGNRDGGGGGGRGYGRNGRGGGGGGRGGRRHGRGRGRGGRHHNPRQSADSGNQRERIAIESGVLVLIDQFMLANPQFIDRLKSIIDEGPDAKDKVIRDYGGIVVEVSPDRYRIERDPYAYSIVVHPEGDEPESEEIQQLATDGKGTVFVDTRCLAMIDRELLDDSSLLDKYKQLWFSGQDKACRDLIRDNGGAVRYGFSRAGDELGVYVIPGQNIVALWPDVAEGTAAADAGSEA